MIAPRVAALRASRVDSQSQVHLQTRDDCAVVRKESEKPLAVWCRAHVSASHGHPQVIVNESQLLADGGLGDDLRVLDVDHRAQLDGGRRDVGGL